MARNGQARTAIACSATASALGSTFGVIILVLLLPWVRGLLLSFGPPEFLMLTVWGLATVAMLGQGDGLKGLAAAGIGLVLAMIGRDPQTAEDRYTLGLDYLQDGLTVVPVLLGLFAFAETIEMMASPRPSIAGDRRSALDAAVAFGTASRPSGKISGCFCAALRSARSSARSPASAARWRASSLMATPCRAAPIGIASEKGTCAASWRPRPRTTPRMVARCCRCSPSASPEARGRCCCWSLFEQHGIVPGRELMSVHLPLVFALIWALFLSNWITSLVGLAISGPLARITVLRTQILAPIILCLAAVGAIATRGLIGDLVVAAGFGLLGYVMRRHGWSRVPLAIGFVLGAAFETNLLLTLRLQQLGRIDMLERPIVLGLALLILGTLLLPAWRRMRAR